MAQFRASSLSYKTGECRRIAAQINDAATAMGLISSVDASRVSASHYVYIVENEDGEAVKIRVSDHDDRHGGSDWYHWDGQCPSATIARVASHFGLAVPAQFTAAAYAARGVAATKAAVTRWTNKRATEAEMLTCVIAALQAEKTPGPVVAGGVVDRLYAGIPRAQRSRMVGSASYIVIRERALSAAAGDEAALLGLAGRYTEARAALFALVGPDRFAKMRPSGFLRSSWKG